MDTRHYFMGVKNNETPRSQHCGGETDTDRPICVVHLMVHRSDNVEVINGGALRNLEGIKREELLQGLDIGEGLVNGTIVKKEVPEDQICIENERFSVIRDIKQEQLDEVDIDRDGLTSGEGIQEYLSEEVEQEKPEAAVHVPQSKGAVLTKKRLPTLMNRPNGTSREQDVVEKQIKQKKLREVNTIIRSCMLRNTRKAAATLQISKKTSRCSDYGTHRGNVSVDSDNECTTTDTDVGDSSRGQLTNTYVCDGTFDDHLKFSLKRKNIQNNGEVSVQECTSVASSYTETRTEKYRLECDMCQRRFVQKTHLVDHLRRHAGEKPFECITCQRKFTTVGSLKLHLKRHTGERLFECMICRRRFADQSNLKQHLKTHTGEKPFQCDICKRSFRFKCHLHGHLKTHIVEKVFQCATCQRRFVDQCRLDKHLRIHTGDKPFKCEICQGSFTEGGSLRRHFRIHTGEKPFKCPICHRSFTENGTLKIHSRTHTGEKPFKCTMCQRSFTNKCNWKSHLKIHTGEKPFECVICKRRFVDQSNLNKHLRTHSGQKPFECTICQRNFTVKSNLKCHLQTHTSDKPFECAICQRKFNRKSNLKIHLRIH